MNYILFQSLVVLVGTALLAPALWAQPTEHAVLAARLNQLGNKSPLYTYSPHAIKQSSASLPSPSVNNGLLDGAVGTPFTVVKKGSVNYVFLLSDSRLEVYTVNPLTPPLDLVNILSLETLFPSGTLPRNMMLVSPDQKTLYLGAGPGGPYFDSIWKIDLSNLPAVPPSATQVSATLVANLTRMGGATPRCYNADISGNQMLVACLDGELFRIDVSTNTVTNNTNQSSLAGYEGGTLAIEPTLGKFAYLTGSHTAPYNMLAIDMATLAVSPVSTLDGGVNVGQVRFHPSGKWAYVIPPGGGVNELNRTVGLLASTPLGTAMAPASGMVDAIPTGGFGSAHNGYGLAIGEKLYFTGFANVPGYDLLVFDINPLSGVLTEKLPRLVSGVKAAVTVLTIEQVAVTVNTNLSALLASTVDATITQTTAKSAKAIVSGPVFLGGGTATVSVSALSVPDGANVKWDFGRWLVNTVPDTALGQTIVRPLTPLPTVATMYTAQYDEYRKVIVVNNGCAATSFDTGWFKDGRPPTATGTPGPGKRFRDIVVELPFPPPGTAIPPLTNNTNLADLLGPLPGGTKVTFTCEDDVIRVTVNHGFTNWGTPTTLGNTVGIVGTAPWAGTGLGTYTSSLVPNGQALLVTSTPVTVAAGTGLRFRFLNWSRNGTVIPGTNLPAASAATTATYVVAAAANNDVFTANYEQQLEVKVNVTGACSVSPVTGWYPSSSSLPITVTPASPQHTATITIPGVGTFNWPLTQALNVSPLTLDVTCAQVTITLVTKPATLGAFVSLTISGVPLGNSGVNTTSLVWPGGLGNFSMSAPASVVSGGIFYQLQNYTRPVAIPVGTTLPVPVVDTTYTANYTSTGYVLTLGGSASCAVSVTSATNAPLQPAPLVYPTGTSVTLKATAAQSVYNFQVTDGTGTKTVTANPITLTLNSPTTVTPSCGPFIPIQFVTQYTVIRDTTVTPNQWVVSANVTFQAPPSLTAMNVTLTPSTFGGITTTTPVPVMLGTMPGGTTRTALLRFPVGGTLISGAKFLLKVSIQSSSSLLNSGSGIFLTLP